MDNQPKKYRLHHQCRMRQWSVRAANLRRKSKTNPSTPPFLKASGRRLATWSTFSRLAKSNSVIVSIRFTWLAEVRDILCGAVIPSSRLFWRTFSLQHMWWAIQQYPHPHHITFDRADDGRVINVSQRPADAEASMDVETGSAASSTRIYHKTT